MVTDGAQCTANFVYTDGATVYLGYAAHCAGTGAATETNGCLAGSLPARHAGRDRRRLQPGTLAYSSWLAMQAAGETNADACAHNDLALVRIAAADVASVNPSIPTWGGPTGVNTGGVALGSRIYTYGNSSLRLGITLVSPKTGVSQGTDADGWNHPVLHGTPRHPRRLRQRPARRPGPGHRRPVAPLGRLPRPACATTTATSAGAWRTPTATASAASGSWTAPSRSTRTPSRSGSEPLPPELGVATTDIGS